LSAQTCARQYFTFCHLDVSPVVNSSDRVAIDKT